VNYQNLEVGAILSNSYRITVSAVQALSVKADPSVKGLKAQYTVSFVTGPRGMLVPTSGEIRVKFPEGTTIPSSIRARYVLINNTPAGAVYRDSEMSNVLRIYATSDIPANHPVNNSF